MSRRGVVGVDDLVLLDKPSEDRVVDMLKLRYSKDQIYTNIGPVLIAINPFKMIPANYTEARIREYRGKSYFELSPHIYALADDAYRNMSSYSENQSIIITGESGSGKTESSKIIMQYISAVSGKSTEVTRVKERMLASNPVLEAFGNAKTINNNNSSRFGKYMVILFDVRGDPVGGNVTNYLLEKSRVVGPSVNERNFHIFYQLCNGMTSQQRDQFLIYTPDYYYYLFRSNCYSVDGINDLKDFQETSQAMSAVGFSKDEINEVFKLVSVILWLGNLTFQEDHTEKASIVDTQVLDIVATLLQVESKVLNKALCFRRIQTGMGKRVEVFEKPNSKLIAENTRDTLAKALYSKMFDYIVEKVNQSIKKDDHQGTVIGVLDIYGFEIFTYNSFEQLCINFVNEKLQQIFIDLTLKSEQEEYRREGIPWQEVKYFNNKPCCELIENKPGVLSVCDDACNTSKTDQMFVQDLSSFFSGHKFIFCGNNNFTITHYAGNVRYEMDGFLEKNKDTLFDDLIEMIQTSSSRFARDHGWSSIKIEAGQKRRPPTVGTTFRKQVSSLVGALTACVPHYIRCIKPNQTKRPNDFDSGYTKNQVIYLGLLENIRVRRAGYASRMTFDRFVDRYGMLSDSVADNPNQGSMVQKTEKILSDIAFRRNEHYAMGKTKIFIREAASLFQIEDLIDRKLNSAAGMIQKIWKRYNSARFFLKIKHVCWETVKGRKERRSQSVNRDYLGDYLNFSYNPIVKGILQSSNVDEKILFADRVKAVLLKGKKSILQVITKAFSKSEDGMSPRFLMLTQEALYSFSFEADPETGKTRAKMFFRVILDHISSITLSPYQDNFLVLHFAAQSGVSDTLQTCKKKTELVGLLADAYKQKTGRNCQLNFLEMDSVMVKKKNKLESMTIRFSKDESLMNERLGFSKSEVQIRVNSGIPASSVPEPYRPPDADPNMQVRDQLKALYDFQGNGVDELSFKEGDVISVIDPEADGWYRGELRGKKGYVPGTYVTLLTKRSAESARPKKKFNNSINKMWEKCYDDESGEYYYYNSLTGQSQWEKPVGFKG